MGQLTFTKTNLEGVMIITPFKGVDDRGYFVKPFAYQEYNEQNLECNFKEHYFSLSHKDVIRGMHFQIPPMAHAKLVYVSTGSIIDLVLDIRKKSATYGQFLEVALSADNNKAIYIPKGFAHGFRSLKDNTIVVYTQTSEYSSVHDMGIRYDSFGYDWQVSQPVLSERDKNFNQLQNFESPF